MINEIQTMLDHYFDWLKDKTRANDAKLYVVMNDAEGEIPESNQLALKNYGAESALWSQHEESGGCFGYVTPSKNRSPPNPP